MKLQLVEDWKDCWRWYSTHATILAIALQGAWLDAPEEMRRSLPWWLVHAVTLAIMVSGFIGRLIAQAKTPTGSPQ